MSCTTTTGMYLGISTDICASASASRSGNTITVSGTFSVSQSGSWNTNAIYAYVDGGTGWTKVKPASNSGGSWSAGFSFSFDDANAGTRNYNAVFQVFNNAETGTVGNPASVGFSISYPANITPPTGLNVTVAEVYPTGAKFNVSISSYGNPSDANGRSIEAGFAGQNAWTSPSLRSAIVQNVMSAQILVDNNSSQTTTLDIVPNTQYYYGGYANNTQAGGGAIFGQLVTLPAQFTISSIQTNSNSADVNYVVDANGGEYDQTLEYSLDGITWNTLGTVSGGSQTLGTHTITGLSPNTTYTLNTRVTTTAGTTDNPDTTFTTDHGFYGSVNGRTKNITKLYGSVGGQTKEIKKMYGSVNGQTKLIYKG